jgi:hypothetical protein
MIGKTNAHQIAKSSERDDRKMAFPNWATSREDEAGKGFQCDTKILCPAVFYLDLVRLEGWTRAVEGR